VAELVQQGKRNKEIAAELFVSLRTVEVRLTRTYNKLGAKSRSHLIALLSGTGTVLSDGAASGMV
ncbi:helix-turn-helix transcriptional regulator, partial [Pseudomonas sp. AB12(2023)]